MEKLTEILSKYETDLALLSNRYFLMILYCLYFNKRLMKIQEISEYLNIPTVKLNQYLDYLIRVGFVKKINKLDKSKSPAFIKTYYEIEEFKYKNLLKNFNKLQILLK